MCKRHHDQHQLERKLEEETQIQTLMRMKEGKIDHGGEVTGRPTAGDDVQGSSLSPEEVGAKAERRLREELEGSDAPPPPPPQLDATEDADADDESAIGAVAQM
jgi:hypothetical protein